LKSAGVTIVSTPSSFGETVAEVLSAMSKAA
ncbi:MAG: succinate--CoA ligase subunit alpha, partial [Pararhizobium sp.]